MSAWPTTTIRIDPQVKESANEVFGEIGLSMSAAINSFLKAVVRENGIPFNMKADRMESVSLSKNVTLNHAYAAKKDEFYTRYEDVTKEIGNYPNNFEGKSVLCNCDNPFQSAFFRYFVLHFEELGLKRLISTCYADTRQSIQGSPLIGEVGAFKAEVTKIPDGILTMPDGSLDIEAIFNMPENKLSSLSSDGDFRSEECKSILGQADIVVTNPPFSLFREYVAQLVQYNKDFLILGNMNASTCKEIFPLFRDDKVWYGESIHSGDRKFFVPDDYPLNASGCGFDVGGRRYIQVTGVRWFTNLNNGRRHKPLIFKHRYEEMSYPHYENYNAIEVSRVVDIPSDYDGIMGVPITFLDKYCPEQFKIIMLANGNARTNVSPNILKAVGYKRNKNDRGGVGIINGKRSYARVLIRRRK